MGYGLFQGLNEAYDSYRGRERDIEDKKRREFVDEQAKTRAEREGVKFDRESEQYEYNVGLRTQTERATTLAIEGAERTATMDEQKLLEFMEPKEIENRKIERTQRLETAKLNAKKAGLQFNDAQILHRANVGAEKYRQWKTEWMSGGTIEKLVQNFNNDRDENGKLIDSNDIKNVIGDETKGWLVEFENGETKTFKDRNAVAIHLENMADPTFHQEYLLGQLKIEADTAIAVSKAKALLKENMLPRQKQWDLQTDKAVKKLYATIFKEGFIEFGDEGAKQLQSIVASIADDIGAASEYKLVHSNVFERIGSLAMYMVDTDPESMRRKAEELYKARPPSEFADGVKPDEDAPEYDDIIKNMMYDATSLQMENLKVKVVNDLLMARKGGGFIVKKQEKPSGDTVTKEGLRRNTDETLSDQVATSDDAGLPERTPETVVTEGKKQPFPTIEKPMPVTQFLANVVMNMGKQGSAFAESEPPTTAKEQKLSQKARRKLEAAAEKALNTNYKDFTPEQKVKWLNDYGKKFLPAKVYQQALRALPKEARALASKGNGLDVKSRL